MAGSVGRNDPCPCGSGKKYKKCHLGTEIPGPVDFAPDQAGAVVTHYPTDQTWGIASEGMSVFETIERRGDFHQVEADPDSFVQFIYAELPRYLPIADSRFRIPLQDDGANTAEVQITRKRRGEQEWSSLDTSHLPYFTRVVVAHETRRGEGRVLKEVLSYLDDMRGILEWEMEPFADVRISYFATHFRKSAPHTPVVTTWHPLREPVHYPAGEKLSVVTEEILLLVNKLRLEIANRVQVGGELWANLGFCERVRWVLEEFARFSREHAVAISALDEEQARDLCLVPMKIALSAEGEAFSHLGKTDIKVRNPLQRRESAIVEFKKWSGPKSAQEGFDQLVRRYATGTEECLSLFFLSNNEDLDRVRSSALGSVRAEAESGDPLAEPLQGCSVTIRGREIPLEVHFADLYHAK